MVAFNGWIYLTTITTLLPESPILKLTTCDPLQAGTTIDTLELSTDVIVY
ncbi:MAG: hypothetical protein R2730_12600 [Chitinophagales bacterium]